MESLTDRVERILALTLLQQLKAQPQKEKVLVLNLAGFSNVEIADLLQTSSQVVAQHLYTTRKGSKRVRKPPPKRKKS